MQNWQPLASSNLAAYRYDPDTQTLSIRFRSGRSYDYLSVPQDIAEGLAQADSPGRYFTGSIKGVFSEG